MERGKVKRKKNQQAPKLSFGSALKQNVTILIIMIINILLNIVQKYKSLRPKK